MAKRTQILLLAVAVLFALVAAWLVTQTLNKMRQAHTQTTVSVVRVTQNIGPHEVVQPGEVTVVQVPAGAAPPSAVTTTDKVIGKYTAGNWFAGQTVLADMVTSTASDASFPLNISPGERAYTMPSDPIVGVDHLISVGDHVDVLVTYTAADSGSHKGKPIAKTVLQDITVLYVDNAPAVQTTATASGTASGSGKSGSGSSTKSSGSVDTITLALTPTQAEKLDYARTFGQVQLVLRNPQDSATDPVAPTDQQP